jgi:hypothetical protein
MDRPISVFLVLLSTCVSLSAQWLQYPEPGIPRTPDGKPNLSAPPPKTPDGKPDFSGVWAVANSELAPQDNQQAGPNQFLDIAPDDKGQPYHRLPYQPGMAEMAKARDTPPKTTEPKFLVSAGRLHGTTHMGKPAQEDRPDPEIACDSLGIQRDVPANLHRRAASTG